MNHLTRRDFSLLYQGVSSGNWNEGLIFVIYYDFFLDNIQITREVKFMLLMITKLMAQNDNEINKNGMLKTYKR